MSSKFNGKLEALGRAGLRDKESKELIAVYPYKVEGTDKEIEEKVKFWFSQKNPNADDLIDNYYVDTLSTVELKNSQEKFYE